MTLKDLHLGANDITVIARVLAMYPVSEFTKKDGSGVGHYRRVNVFDGDGIARVTIWEDNEDAMKLSGITVDTPVRLVSAYVKQGLDGKPALNIGKRGRIEKITDQSLVLRMPSLASLARRVDEIKDGEVVFAVEGVAITDSRRSTFVRRDNGSQGSLTQFEIKGEGERVMRVVVWDGSNLLDVKSGSRVRVTSVRQRKGRQEEAELHGDGGTVIQALGEGTAIEPEARMFKVADLGSRPSGGVDLEVMALSKGSVREVSMKDGSKAKKGEVVLGDDTGEITAVAWDDASKVIGEIKAGEKIRVRGGSVQPSRMGGETLELGSSSKIERL